MTLPSKLSRMNVHKVDFNDNDRLIKGINKFSQCKPHRLCNRLKMWFLTRKFSSKTMLTAIFLVIVLVLYIILHSKASYTSGLFYKNSLQFPIYECQHQLVSKPHQHSATANGSGLTGKLLSSTKVLLFSESYHSKALAEILVANKIKYKQEIISKSLPILTNLSRGKYGVVVFENFENYLLMDRWNRELLDKYMSDYRVGLIGFMPTHDETRIGAKLRNFPLYVHTKVAIKNVSLVAENPVLRIARAGAVASDQILQNENWLVFKPDHATYLPLQVAHTTNTIEGSSEFPFSVLDRGKLDGIQRVLFGGGLQFWLNRLLVLDAISYLSMGKLSIPLERFILVDIDDIFVGPKNNRLTPSDVQALIESQERLAKLVPGWKFNLGFSGNFFQRGAYIENLGDEYLLQNVDKFWWFGHMWGHTQPHKVEATEKLVKRMERNRKFALDHGIPTDSGYSVSPHHSGVYPVHEKLYEAWKQVWNIRVTSTEEYPHLRPARLRQGFIHKNIMVLPRQTCGLYTHTVFLESYPGGRQVLDTSIRGGELFETIISNPISIFMTHQGNYGNDRIALYTFESVIHFLKCWTNLDLKTAPPLQLGEKYFHLNPNEVDPMWGNPCMDRRHLEIWSLSKSCNQLPQFLVIGPQKTGTTALYTFLSMHPSIVANLPSADTFEEVQFFNGRNYYKGIDWYMGFFPVPSENDTAIYTFEKSATYFDGELVPKRVKSLLPTANLVSIIIPPHKRAYSWYHHMRAHGDPTAIGYSFYDVITASSKAPKPLRSLKNKCLNPGMYAKYLERWLDHFPQKNIYVIDGEGLRSDPIFVLDQLQKFLNIEPHFDYTKHLRYDQKKGFFCQVLETDKTKCLGRGKGREYPPMEAREEEYLKRFYEKHNASLEELLRRLGFQIPSWLGAEHVKS